MFRDAYGFLDEGIEGGRLKVTRRNDDAAAEAEEKPTNSSGRLGG